VGLLELRDVHVGYGGIKAVKGISLRVDEGEIVTIVGNNGAGKTTTMKTIAGLLRPTQGKITFLGHDLTNKDTTDIVKLGIQLVPEGRQIFPAMSVMENLEMGAFTRPQSDVGEGLDMVFDLFPRLKERASQQAGTLSGGEQQMLAIGRALMAKPKLLLLDEPSLGLAPILVQGIFELIEQINRRGTAILLVEQNARMALSVSDRGYVLETGRIVASDTSASLLQSNQVKNAYLGMKGD
jgi:branched-chain amino acid transport system ATP-binding protein